ncbi:MAG: OmpA family protein [Flavicella sp.]
MERLKISLMALFLLVGMYNVNAQDVSKKWAFSFGINMVDINKTGPSEFGDFLKDYVGESDWNTIPAISHVSVVRYLDNGFNLELNGALNKIDKAPINVDGLSFFALDLGTRYDLNHLNFIGETGWFDPYLRLGIGVTWLENQDVFTINGGAGFNTWFNDTVGLNFSTMYKNNNGIGDNLTAVQSDGYFHHAIGVVFRFGGQDSDGDGVGDAKDACPNVAGSRKLNGCPDSDGDGIVNKEDACPNIAGLKMLKGCPDSDGDGISDTDDMCPENAGLKKFKGCPDTDGDGVQDSKDMCPKVAGDIKMQGCLDSDGDGVIDPKDDCKTVKGAKRNKGCPWPDTDGDGVADKDDICKDTPGLAKNKGCPALSKAAIKKLGSYAKTINFNSGKATFKKGVAKQLDAIVVIMKKYPTIEFDINGYTDSLGSAAKNLKLSDDRAHAVRDYLVSHGISEKRMSFKGYGIKNPIDTNKTAKGRANNRRVEIIAKQ